MPVRPLDPAPRRTSLALALALVAYALLVWRFDFLCDDAYISFRYARNLASGEGLAFNPGRTPPVEGYSNFLWVLLMALAEALGADPGVVSRALSSACGLGLGILVLRVARARFELGGPGLAATAFFLATLPPLALWATSGLETMPFTLCMFACYERLLGAPGRPRAIQAGALGLTAALLRADGALWVGMVLGAAVLAEGLRSRAVLRAALGAGLVVALGVVAHVAWRRAYYGDWLPNTARVKAGLGPERLGRGVDYLAAYALALPALPLVALAALHRWAPGRRGVWLPALVVLVGSAGYSAWVGGDFMPFGRFLFNAVPFLVLVFAALWRGPLGTRGTLAAGASAIALSVLAALDVHPLGSVVREHLHFRQDRDEWQTEVARWREMKENTARWKLWGRAMALHTKLGESIICGAAGAQNYFCELRAYDTYGLVTPEVVEHRRKHPKKGAASPGHDLGVHEGFFFPPEHGGKLSVRPTYLGGFLWADPKVYPQRPWWAGALPKGWSEHAWSRLVDIERYPLRAEDGFPQGSELRMLRFHWD